MLPQAMATTDTPVDNIPAEIEVAQEKTESVDLSGLELLSAASMEQIERSVTPDQQTQDPCYFDAGIFMLNIPIGSISLRGIPFGVVHFFVCISEI